MNSCISCGKSFEIFPEDEALSEKLKMPLPDKCFDCNQQHLMSFVNHFNLYARKCDATGENIISNFSPDKPYKVFKVKEWWSDTWDAANDGRDFDFTRPFFEQFQELSLAVPRPALFTAFQYDENSDYTNHAGKDKNCYMIFDSDENRDCFYSYSINKCMDCSDLYRSRQSELCYEIIDSQLCYNSSFLKDCAECRDSAFLENCRSCKNCFMCVNLQHKEYFYKNEFVGKEKFEELMKQLRSRQKIQELRKEMQEFRKQFPQRFLQIYKSENSVGNYLVNCKNAFWCFDSNNLWDCRYVTQGFMNNIKDCMNCVEIGGGVEMVAMSATVGYNANNIKFCYQVIDEIRDAQYSAFCHFSSNLFGCVGLRHKQFHILNKKYEPKEYHEMVKKITEHMKSTGERTARARNEGGSGSASPSDAELINKMEYGKFFPRALSPFAYNETLAQQWYPLTKEEAIAKGWKWHDEKEEFAAKEAASAPDNIADVNEAICQQILQCQTCSRKFRITKQEFAFYKRQGIAVPNQCFKCRHFARANMRRPRKIFKRKCSSCGDKIISNIGQESKEIVYCEKCYLEKVY